MGHRLYDKSLHSARTRVSELVFWGVTISLQIDKWENKWIIFPSFAFSLDDIMSSQYQFSLMKFWVLNNSFTEHNANHKLFVDAMKLNEIGKERENKNDKFSDIC